MPGRVLRRFHLFEIFAVANLAMCVLMFGGTLPLVGNPVLRVMGLAKTLLVNALAGIALRIVVALLRRDRSYLRRIRRPAWILGLLRMVGFTALTFFGYAWVKLIVPVVHPRLFDEELWQIDRLLFFGVSPSEMMLRLFDSPSFLRAIDWSYASIFYASTVVAFAYFASDPSERVRNAFADGVAALWLAGGWLYLLIPSLGPAYRFPDIWFAYADSLRTTQYLQSLLMRNFQNVLAVVEGREAGPIHPLMGIGAFPSLHVAFQTFVFLWMRRLWTSGEILFGVFALTILLGSMITGWHYLVDGLAGIALAVLAWSIFWRRARLSHWIALRDAVRRTR